MDRDTGIVASFLITIFLISFAFHLLYVKGYAYDWAISNLEQQHNEEGHNSNNHTPREPEPHH